MAACCFALVPPHFLIVFSRAPFYRFEGPFSMAKSKGKGTKGISKTGAATRAASAAAATAASASAAAATATARSPPPEGTGPATRSSSSPSLEPDSTAVPHTAGELANAGSQPRVADVPRHDTQPSGAQATGDASRLLHELTSARQQLANMEHRIQQMQALDIDASHRRPPLPQPRLPAERQEVVPYVPPAPPPPAFQYGMFSGTQGLAELLATMSVSYSAIRIPNVLAQPVHVFPMPEGSYGSFLSQATASYHYQMYNFFDFKLKPLPTTWSVFSEVLVTAARHQQSIFGVHAAQELETLMRCFGADLDELRQEARSVNFSKPIDVCVIHVFTKALRDANPLSIFAAVTAEIARLRVAIYDAQPVQPNADRGARGRGPGDHYPAPNGGGSGSAPGALERCTVVENSPQHGLIRKGVRGPDGRYAAGVRCFKCGSSTHRVDACTALPGAVDKWVQNAEPAQ